MRLGWGAWIAAALVAAGPATAAPSCVLSFGWDAYPPFEIELPDGSAGGVDVQLLGEAAQAAGCSLVAKRRPWLRLLGELEAGETDIGLDATPTPERLGFARFSVPYRNDRLVLFLRRGEGGRLGPAGVASIAGTSFRLGAQRGFAYGSVFEQLMHDPRFAANVELVPGNEVNLLDMLVARHIDGFLENLDAGRALVARQGRVAEVEPLLKPLQSDDVSFMFSRRSVDAAIVARFDTALEAMRRDGRADRILAAYLEPGPPR